MNGWLAFSLSLPSFPSLFHLLGWVWRGVNRGERIHSFPLLRPTGERGEERRDERANESEGRGWRDEAYLFSIASFPSLPRPGGLMKSLTPAHHSLSMEMRTWPNDSRVFTARTKVTKGRDKRPFPFSSIPFASHVLVHSLFARYLSNIDEALSTQNHVKNSEGGRSYLRLGVSLTSLHLPGF